MPPSRRRTNPPSLSAGRPKSGSRPPPTLSSRKTRALIRSHHTLQKSLAQAHSRNDEVLAASISQQLASSGGLAAYQAASLTGQSEQRGGDTSKTLLAFLKTQAPAMFELSKVEADVGSGEMGKARKLRMLDVGALSTDTAVSRSGLFDVTRIDLHSQAKGIQEQDFMARPLPSDDIERFDVIGLSLVVNYVPDAKGRGEMLKRVRKFLVRSTDGPLFPAVFLVLPAPCVLNSRYMDKDKLAQIMQSLGFHMLEMKVSAKLVYYLWRWDGVPVKKTAFGKKELAPGGARNNFAIVIE